MQELLSDAGVSVGRIQGFFRRVDHFNDSVKQEWLTDGFEEAELLYTKYDPYAMQDEWTAKNGTFPGYNCRITAMNLFGDFLSVSADSQINAGEDVLFVDEEALDVYKRPAYASAAFHERFIKGHITLVGCPKLDGVDYSEKLTEIIQNNDIKSVTVVRMEVPCCGGLELAAKKALRQSGKFIPWQVVTVTVDGRLVEE